MTKKQKLSQERFDFAMRRADRKEAMRRWRDQLRGVDLYDESGLFERLAEVIGPLYEYLAKAQNTRSMGMRAWCLLYAVRPELIDYQTIQAAADSFGVTQEALCYQLKQLEASFPGFTYIRRMQPPPNVLRERMEKANQASCRRFTERSARVA